MRVFRLIGKWFLCFLMIPTGYLVISLILTLITVNSHDRQQNLDKHIYLSTNGVHLEIIIPKYYMDSTLLKGIKRFQNEDYLSFGWGEENFYLNTPQWSDLTFSNAFKAAFLESSTLIHVTRFKQPKSKWIKIPVTKAELKKLNQYLIDSFNLNESGNKVLLKNQGYTQNDDFYKAKGSYSCFKTCNSWVNSALKESGLKSSLWTPFDFGLLHKYQ